MGSNKVSLGEAKQAWDFFNSSRTSLAGVLNVFDDFKDIHLDIPKVLQIFEEIRQENTGFDIEDKERFPLIVLEGLDGSGKSTVGKLLAKKIGAEQITTPPKALSTLRKEFDGHYCLHAPFYFLGNYLAAFQVLKTLKIKPVVMDRFWHSTTAFALAQLEFNYSNPPQDLEDVYEWPQDLLKPDIVILLDVSEEERNRRLSRRKVKTEQEELLTNRAEFRKSVLKAYENMKNPKVDKVNGDRSLSDTVEEVHKKIQYLL